MPVGLRRLALRSAYRAAQVWWFVRRPHTRGLKLVIRHGDDVLFVRHTYGDRHEWELPGGGQRASETPEVAAARETREELGIDIADWSLVGEFEARDFATAHLACLTASVDDPSVSLDPGELQEARWASPQAPPEPLGPHARKALTLFRETRLPADGSAAFRFCPVCARSLEVLDFGLDAGRLGCPTGHFVHYGNPAVTVFAFLEQDGEFLILRRAHAPCLGEWDVPGGFVERGERPAEAVLREISEETGLLDVDVVEVIGAYTSRYGPAGKGTVDIGFHCQLVDGEMQISAEKSEARWVTLDECPRFAFAGQNDALADLSSAQVGIQPRPTD